MSYCRFIEGDVYVFEGYYTSGDGYIECCACLLMPDRLALKPFRVARRSYMVTHLEHHRERGHEVPQHALDRLVADITEFGDMALGREGWDALAASGTWRLPA